MLHRITLRLYDDNPLDAEILDLLASYDRHRKQDALKTFLRVGFKMMMSEKVYSESISEHLISSLESDISVLTSNNNQNKPIKNKEHGLKINKKILDKKKEYTNNEEKTFDLDEYINEEENNHQNDDSKNIDIKDNIDNNIDDNQELLDYNPLIEDDEDVIIDPLAGLMNKNY